MAQQYPDDKPPVYSRPNQYIPPQSQLYAPPQAGSRPTSPYQWPAQPYPEQGYPQAPARTPSPYQQPPQGPNPYQQYGDPQGYAPQRYPSPQQYPYPPAQGYPVPQGYPPQPYAYAPAPQQSYQSYQQAPQSSPQPFQQPQTSSPYTLLLAPTSTKHCLSLTLLSTTQPLYLIHYNRPLIATTRPEISITAGQSGETVATAHWHTWSSKIDLSFPSQSRQITYKNVFEPVSANSQGPSIGRISWELLKGDSKYAEIKGADGQGNTVVTISVRDRLSVGKIEVWSHGLQRDVLEQIVASGVAEIEDWRRKCENAAVNPGVIAGGIVAGMNS